MAPPQPEGSIPSSSTMNLTDRRFWPKTEEPGFSPERNKKVIEESIKKYEKNRAKKIREFQDNFGERAEAVASLWRSKAPYARLTDRRIEKYFGKQYLAHLQGKKIGERINSRLSTVIGKSKAPNPVRADGTFKGRNVGKKAKKGKEKV